MTKPHKNSDEMWTSVSAIGDGKGCLRRWWFKKVVKMPERQRAATIFGDVGHAVWDRFYRADDRGLVDGVPVNLYPDGWMTMCNRFDKTKTKYTVSQEEAALIMALVDKGISGGYMVRTPGRIVEKEISTEILNVGHTKVILRGYIDLDLPDGLEDHKFLKDKKWAKSPAKLIKDIQMMGYGYAKKVDGHKGNLHLTHNNFIKSFDNLTNILHDSAFGQFQLQVLRIKSRYLQGLLHSTGQILFGKLNTGEIYSHADRS